MEQPELLQFIAAILEQLDIPHMIVGSYASGAYGDPRFTQDIDIVIDPSAIQLDALLARLPPEKFYVSREAAIQSLRSRGQFNVIDPISGAKIDFMIAKNDAWAKEQLRRRVRLEILKGLLVYTARPEDVVISKMLYYKEGASEKHLRDIASMCRVSGSDIDQKYIQQWANQLDIMDIWQAILKRLGSP